MIKIIFTYVDTILGSVSLTRTLLDDEHTTDVALGHFQSNALEGEFGVIRQLSGGCYYVAVDQVLVSVRFRNCTTIWSK